MGALFADHIVSQFISVPLCSRSPPGCSLTSFVDVAVCNAGRQQSKASILDITGEDFDATMKSNIYAPFGIIKPALPHLGPGPAIIGTTSEQAYDPSADLCD